MTRFVQILFGNSPAPAIHDFAIRCIALALLPLAACSSAPDDGASSYKGEFAQVFGAPASEAAQRDAPWAIVLSIFSGPGALERAESSAAQLRETAGLVSARARSRSNGALVLFGAYPAPDDRNAQRDLARLKALTIEGVAPFATAFLSPQQGPADGSIPELNLNNAKKNHGAGARYTLQIAVYQSEKQAEARRAAEDAAVALRNDGELAFYYHGPTRSMVTVGLFGDRDYNPSTDKRSAKLLDTQQRFPHNLLNGRTIVERRIGGQRTQPSALVQVPDPG